MPVELPPYLKEKLAEDLADSLLPEPFRSIKRWIREDDKLMADEEADLARRVLRLEKLALKKY